MKLIYGLIVILFLAIVVVNYKAKQHDGFQGKDKTIVICKADWCGHCKTAAPEFKKLMAASPITLADGSKAVVNILDADRDKAALSKYSVKGFPTILIDTGSEVVEYPHARTANKVIEFVKSM
jgi:thiol-disulfide isomerase/thioredoxin